MITGDIRSERNEAVRNSVIDEMLAVLDACQAQGLSYTILADPQWDTGSSRYGPPERKGLCEWLLMAHEYWFHTGHGSFLKCKDEQYRAHVLFVDAAVGGNNYYVAEEYRHIFDAFSDLGIDQSRPDQYRIVHMNTCFSAGNWLKCYDATIAQAFGIFDWSEEQVYVGWNWFYWPLDTPIPLIFSPDGADWTRGFWYYLGQGYTVSQAEFLVVNQYWDYTGLQHNFLVNFGDPYTTWLTVF